jgi:hypothetical protein
MNTVDNKNMKVNNAAVAAVGAMVGAGIAVAGAMALKDKKVSDKVKEAGKVMEEKADNYVKKAKKETEKVASKLK